MRTIAAFFLTMVTMSFAQSPSPTATIQPAREIVSYAPKPIYPESLRKQHKGGAGVFVLHVNPSTGVVSSVTVKQSTGVPLLDRTCKETFVRWRFKPGRAAPTVLMPITFTAQGAQY